MSNSINSFGIFKTCISKKIPDGSIHLGQTGFEKFYICFGKKVHDNSYYKNATKPQMLVQAHKELVKQWDEMIADPNFNLMIDSDLTALILDRNRKPEVKQ